MSAIKAKKEATKKLLSESDLSKLPLILDNCRDISSQSQVVQDSLEKAICDIKSGKLKAQLSKLEEARDANIAFMNELGPALANCQNIQFEPWKSKPCSGPCNFEWEQTFSFDSTQCKKGLRKALNVKCTNYYETPITVQSVRRTGSPSWFAYCNQVGFKESLSTFARDYCEASVITNKKFAKTKTGIGSVNTSGDWEPCLDEVQLSASELSSVKEEAIAEALEVAAIQWARYTAGEYFSPQVSDIAISFVPFVNVANDLRQLPFGYYYSATGISDLKKAGHWTGVIGGLVLDILETRGALKYIEANPSILSKGFETFKRYFTGMQSVGKAFIRPGLRINKQSRAYAMIIPFPTVNLSDNFKSALDEINKLLYEGKLDGNLVRLTGGVDSQGNLLGEIEISNQKVTVLLSEDEAKLIKFAQEGAQGVGAIVPNSLVSKLTQQGADNLKAWTSSKGLNYKSLRGENLSGIAAESKIFEDLESAIGNKNVLETLEDTQGRLSVVLERPGQTNQVVSIHPTSTGELRMTTFEPAYNPNLNTNISVPISKNRLVPDYNGTQYMHPDNVKYIANNQGNGILIEMQGTRGKDFSEAFKKLGIKASDAGDYTWHHLDDFQIINGKPYCTMQLVLSEGHGGAGIKGMAHSGSVAQWKAYFGITTYP
ncbi:HNH endonuclease [Flectobacillus longus]|uniref:HNH endonuclease n=1 Tax=Flectobacillus longus TaxID=2984207 RepID=UPI0024B8013C|nr:HNH endonuclease [Flectobacillus longus]MDI9882798.1 HNH endonuclease [Flectobacillus longus]